MQFHTQTCMHTLTQAYLQWHDSFTHEDFVVGSKLWGVVIHIFHFDVDAHFGVLVVAS